MKAQIKKKRTCSKMTKSAIIGLGFGDCGKGVVTDFVCSQRAFCEPPTVVRFSGGHQAAHTVTRNKGEHVFSNFGSGTLLNCPTYWSEYCTFEPSGFCREYDILVSKGFTPKITVSPSCLVTTPFDIAACYISPERTHGTTGTGFWKTIERNQKGPKLTVGDLFAFDKTFLESKMKEIARYHGLDPGEHLQYGPLLTHFYVSVGRIQTLASIVLPQLRNKELIFEGSQGLLLDKEIGFWPHVTPSKTNLDNIFAMGYTVDDVYLVTRAYQTRHGAGPMTNINLPLPVCETYEAATRKNDFQGELRKTVLDLDLLQYGVNKGITKACKDRKIVKHLVVTCLDQFTKSPVLTHYGEIKVFKNDHEFVKYIRNALSIDGNLYANYSPKSSSITQIER